MRKLAEKSLLILRLLPALPLIAGAIALTLFVMQGGFGGGHAPYDLAIGLLGLPSILVVTVYPLQGLMLPDFLALIVVPALLNSLLAFALWRIVARLVGLPIARSGGGRG